MGVPKMTDASVLHSTVERAARNLPGPRQIHRGLRSRWNSGGNLSPTIGLRRALSLLSCLAGLSACVDRTTYWLEDTTAYPDEAGVPACPGGDCGPTCPPDGCPVCRGRPDFTPCQVVTQPDRSYDICVGGQCVSPGCGDKSCNVPGPSFQLPDTNQRRCFSDAGPIACPDLASCASAPLCGQDAQYGWDTNHLAAERFARTEPVIGEPVVEDLVTGLLWQGCAKGRKGRQCDELTSDWAVVQSEALAFCDALVWGGHDDWHLPDLFELESLLDRGRAPPHSTIDADAFPSTLPDEFWTSTTSSERAANPQNHWFVSFESGAVVPVGLGGLRLSVRCVRRTAAAAVAPAVRYQVTEPVADQPVVRDALTTLVWQRCAAGTTGRECLGTPPFSPWPAALGYCETLDWGGRTTWRLPNVREVLGLIDPRHSPAVDAAIFPSLAAAGSSFWSSTPRDDAQYGVFAVSMYTGQSGVQSAAGNGAATLCVSDGVP